MGLEIATKDDLEKFRIHLINEIRAILQEGLSLRTQDKTLSGIKTKQVKELLKCSTNTLNSLVIKRTIKTKKIGGSLYYDPTDVERILKEGYR